MIGRMQSVKYGLHCHWASIVSSSHKPNIAADLYVRGGNFLCGGHDSLQEAAGCGAFRLPPVPLQP